jgi:threonine/homoserine/homoserine lactone efflux protein
MSPEFLFSLVALSFAASWTPGPNNALVASSGANFGLRRTMPHVLGIALGFPVMVFIVGLALGEAFQSSVILREILRWGGSALLLWVAWQIATSGGLGHGPGAARPFSFIESAAFQWVNPKGWVMAIAITAQFISPAAPFRTATWVALVFVAAGLTSSLAWAAMGQLLRSWLAQGRRLAMFNLLMGALIALGVVGLIVDGP